MTTTQQLSRDTARHIASLIQPVVVDLIALTLNAKQAHWHVRGPHFISVHEQLDSVVATARTYTDELAERMIALSMNVDGRPSTVAEHTRVAETQPGFTSDEKTVAAIVEQLDAVVERARATLAPLDDLDLVTQDIVVGALRELEKIRWMFDTQTAH